MKKIKWVVPTFYIIFLMLPIYWLLNMSFKSTTEIINVYSLWPQEFTLDNYKTIFTDSTWYMGYVNSIMYTVFNTIISVSAALPAAYAFSRYKFLGDKHLFFWLLTNRMAPPAVFALPFFQFYSSVNLFDTHIAIALSHCLFNIPLAVWILEGFMFSWVELLLAKTLTATIAKPIAAIMTRTSSTSGYELGLLAAAGSLTILPGAFVIYFVRNYIAKGFAMGRV